MRNVEIPTLQMHREIFHQAPDAPTLTNLPVQCPSEVWKVAKYRGKIIAAFQDICDMGGPQEGCIAIRPS